MKTKLHLQPFLFALFLFLAAPPAPAQTGFGSALSLDGVDDYVRVTNGVYFNTNFTIEAWVYARDFNHWPTLLDFGNGPDADNVMLALGWSTGVPFFQVFPSGQSVQAPSPVPLNQWVHLAVTLTNNTATIYVNGLPVVSDPVTAPRSVTRTNNYLGWSDWSGNNHANVMLDEVRIWNVARSAADIQANLSHPLAATEPGLVAYWPFDEAGGTTAHDATTNHFHGTLANRPLRVPSYWWPVITLNSPNPLTNECHTAFVDPTTANAAPVAIAAGYYHSLALKADGSVVGWGYNFLGQTTIPAGATNGVVAIAAGYSHSLALKADGSVVGWGYNGSGQTTIPAGATNGVVAIAAGYYHSLALKADGSVIAWGNNGSGQTTIPDGATNGVVAIAGGMEHSLALKADGSVVGWGYNYDGQTTIPAGATNGVVAIAAGLEHSLALKADGSVVGWGYNYDGQTTIPAGATNGVVAIAGGYYHSLALKADGSVVGWGSNGYGQITIPAGATNGVVAIAAGWAHSLTLKADGSVVGWGWNGYGQTTIPAGLSKLNLPIAVSGTGNANSPGSYVLSYSATNALGAVGTATRTVIVTDTQPPLLTLLRANPLLHEVGAPFTDPGATATDLCAGDLTASIVSNLTVNISLPGTYTNTFTVTDASGNSAQTNGTVIVRDTTPPALTCPANVVVTANPGQCEALVSFLAPTATDAVDPNPVVTCPLPSGTWLPVGRTNILCTAWDASGNTNTCSFTVTVRLPAQPVFAGYCVPAPGQFGLRGTGTAGLTYTLQTSANLVDWVDHTNVVADPAGLVECLEDMDTNAPACFYRLRWP